MGRGAIARKADDLGKVVNPTRRAAGTAEVAHSMEVRDGAAAPEPGVRSRDTDDFAVVVDAIGKRSVLPSQPRQIVETSILIEKGAKHIPLAPHRRPDPSC